MRFPTPQLTYANVMSTAAAFIALGGVSWAAVTLPKNSVGPTQIRNGAVSEKKLSNAVKAKLAQSGKPGATGAAGPQGPTGQQGLKGEQGVAGNPRARALPRPTSSRARSWARPTRRSASTRSS